MFETMPRCCVHCFAHEWLRDYARERSRERGNCDYCGREEVAVLGVGALYDPFRNLLRLYVPSDSPHGSPLVDLIQDTHEVFDDDLHTSDESARLLQDIM